MMRQQLGLLACASSLFAFQAGDWPTFRGSSGTGSSAVKGVPVRFGPEQNVVWKVKAPNGASSPVIAGDKVLLTGSDDNKVYVLAFDAATGRELWKREIARPRKVKTHPLNTPASPSPATDGESVFVYFGEVGLIRYSLDGKERWRVPTTWNAPVYGYSSSPVLAGRCVVLFNDGENSHGLVAYDKSSGKLCWKDERRDIPGTSYSTPAVGKSGKQHVLVVPASFQTHAYDADTGRRLWWVRGLPFEPKGTPLIADGVAYVIYQGLNGGNGYKLGPYSELSPFDGNGDGVIDKAESVKHKGLAAVFDRLDFDGDGRLTKDEWDLTAQSDKIGSKFFAVPLGKTGDVTADVKWTVSRSVPDVPSPALLDGVAYMVRDGGIFTSIDVLTGAVVKQARLEGALDKYYASPVIVDGHVYCASESGKVVVVKAGGQWELEAVNDLGEEVYATPAPVSGGLVVRTSGTLYRFGASASSAAEPAAGKQVSRF